MSNKATTIIKSYLQPDEVVIWTGQPKQQIIFEVVDIFKTIYCLILLAFTFIAVKLLADISLLLAIPIAIIFFSGSLLLLIGRYFIDAKLREHTYYGLTDKRIIITSKKFPKVDKFVYIEANLKIDFLPNLDNTTTIDIGLKEPSGRGGEGINWLPNMKAYSYLYKLSDGHFVHKKIKELIELSKNKSNL